MIIFPQFKKYDESLKHSYSEGHLIHSLSKQAATKFNLNIESLVELKQSGVQDCLGWWVGVGFVLEPRGTVDLDVAEVLVSGKVRVNAGADVGIEDPVAAGVLLGDNNRKF